MKRIATRLAVLAATFGGAVAAMTDGVHIMGRLSTNHSEPVVSAD